MKRVLTVGVFDLFHIGHLNLFFNAKEHGDYLIVAVHNDINKSKGVDFFFDIKDRIRLIRELRTVDEVIEYERVDKLVERVDFDVFCYGPDQSHEYFQKAFAFCTEKGKSLVSLDRTPGISSSAIRDFIERQNADGLDGRYYS